MDEADLFKRMDVIVGKIERLDRENPTGPDEPTDPRIVKLLDEADIITKQLDPIMRERYRGNPAKLAEWDEIIHSCDDLDEEPDTGKATELPR